MSDSEWKTVRVRKQAWEQAQEQRHGVEPGEDWDDVTPERTWSEQVVRGEDAGGLDVDALQDALAEEMDLPEEYTYSKEYVEGELDRVLSEVGKAVELAEQARDNTDEIKEKLK